MSTGSHTNEYQQDVAYDLLPATWVTVRDIFLPAKWTTRKLTYYWIRLRDIGLAESIEGDESSLMYWRRKRSNTDDK